MNNPLEAVGPGCDVQLDYGDGTVAYCTLTRGHPQPHVAHDRFGQIAAKWDTSEHADFDNGKSVEG